MSAHKIIIDVDVGMDDVWAIYMLVKCEKLYNYKIVAITCSFGNTSIDFVGRNVLMVLTLLGRTDIPVYLGCSEPIIIPNKDTKSDHFGSDGLNNSTEVYFSVDTNILEKKHAVNAIKDILLENEPRTVSLLCVAPLTNLGLSLKLFPTIRKRILEVYILGGNYQYFENATESPEFNFYNDPEAVDIVLKCTEFPIKILPIEPITAELFFISMDWRLNLLPNLSEQTFFHFMNTIELNEPISKTAWIPYDGVLASIFLSNDVVKEHKIFLASVECSRVQKRGLLLLHHSNNQPSNISIITKLDKEKFQNLFQNVLRFRPNDF